MKTFWKTGLPIVALLVTLALFIGGCGQKTTAPEGTTETGANPEVGPSDMLHVTEADLGVALYPGATQVEGQKESGTLVAKFETSDDYDRVVAFYKEKFPNGMTTSTDSSFRCATMDAKYSTVEILKGTPVTISIEQQAGE